VRITRDTVIAAVLVGFSIAAWLWLIPTFAGTGEQTLMPRIAVVLTGVLSLMLLGASLHRRTAGIPAAADDDPFLEMGAGEPPRLIAIMAVWGVFLMVPGVFGLYLGAGLATALSLAIVGIRRPLTIVVWTLVPLGFMFVSFEYGFGLRIPRGTLVTWLLY
jgi:hypothetical protein